jgi:hypothetical protein
MKKSSEKKLNVRIDPRLDNALEHAGTDLNISKQQATAQAIRPWISGTTTSTNNDQGITAPAVPPMTMRAGRGLDRIETNLTEMAADLAEAGATVLAVEKQLANLIGVLYESRKDSQ